MVIGPGRGYPKRRPSVDPRLGLANDRGARAATSGKTTSEYRPDPKNTACVAMVAASTTAAPLARMGPFQRDGPRRTDATRSAA